jgi:hypothetical protein
MFNLAMLQKVAERNPHGARPSGGVATGDPGRRAERSRAGVTVTPVATAGDRKQFVELPFTLYRDDPHWVPPLKGEVFGLIDPRRNPWFGHGEAALFLARRDGRPVGRISAHLEKLPMVGAAPGTGNFGLFEAEDQEVAAALIGQAEAWLRRHGMTHVLGPLSLSIWDEPGLLIEGFDQAPTVMMGHNSPRYEAWIEAAGYAGVKDLLNYEVGITQPFPAVVRRIVQEGERNTRIRIRNVDKSRFNEEAALILGILNDAWSDNWGFVTLTPAEIAYVGKKLKPIVYDDLIRIAEVDGEPVAFMLTLPDLNELTADLGGRLFPFGWVKLLWRMREPKVHTVRTPLMGVVRKLHGTRLASQLAFMMIQSIRDAAHGRYGATRGELGWVLEDNQGMRSIAKALESRLNKIYRLYGKTL